MSAPGRIWADPARERLNTPATVVTVVRTVASVVLAAVAASQQDLTLLVVALVVHWVGDSLDGWVARTRDCETRTGAVLDILCDRLCFAAFYVGLAWLEPHLAPAIFVYLAMFMVVDCFLSLSFLAWPITSPNYFYVIDRRLWLRNWSHPAKAVNSGLFAILLLVTGWMWLGLAIALALLAAKCYSLASLLRLRMPVPSAPPGSLEAPESAEKINRP
jgi:CDP-diacylglycerol---glycerol-3-phosphate 3-phosphatidyltransferase